MWLVVHLGHSLVRLIGATWRVQWHGRNLHDERERGADVRAVHTFWHRSILPLAVHCRGQKHCVVISEHRDGEIIARIAQRFGFVTARGSSTRGGGRALREIKSHLAQGCGDVAITPDGPRGPAEVVKRGVVFCALLTGLPMMPVGIAAGCSWRFRSWDGFELPKPFARIVICVGEPIAVDEDRSPEAVEHARAVIQQAMVAVNRRARQLLDAGTVHAVRVPRTPERT
ncbi:MAG: lysophospholipid acyltransferase family protein [Planctomycetota bacterium]